MMRRYVLKGLFMMALTVFSVACQQLPEDEAEVSVPNEEPLGVKVRSAEGAEVVYPLHLYAFAEDGQLAASQVVESSDDKMSLSLKQGVFQIVAVSGSSKDYQLPKKPALDDVIVWVGSKGAETPLMIGRTEVNVENSGNPMAEITLSYMVASLGVKLQDVPANVANVQVTLLPLHSSLSLAGKYGGESQSVKVDCSSVSEGVWTSEKVYIFPGNGKETYFSITFKTTEGEEVTYGYTYAGKPEANKHFNIKGSYKGEVIVGGSFDVQDWEGSIDVEFDFGASVESEDEENDGNADEGDGPDIDLTDAPEVGTIWNGSIVADWGEADETGVELLLMSLDEWEVVTSQVEEVIDGYSVNGIADWRLPTYEEAKVLRARFSGNALMELNELVKEYDSSLYGLSDGEDERYLCDKDGKIYSFKFAAKSNITEAKSRPYYLRLVKTYHMSLE